MAHQVGAKMKDIDLANTGSAIELKIKKDGEVLGHLKLGKGSFRWRSKHERSDKILDWTSFFRFLESNADEFKTD